MTNNCLDCQLPLVPERASGYMGFRCTNCGKWFYQDQHTNKPLKTLPKGDNETVGWYFNPNDLSITPIGKKQYITGEKLNMGYVWLWESFFPARLSDTPKLVSWECVCNDLMAVVTILEQNYKLNCPQNRFQPTG